jgi:hypothetical protein
MFYSRDGSGGSRARLCAPAGVCGGDTAAQGSARDATPTRWQTLQLGELAIDPFTGAPFVYRVDPQRGFLLYSKGKNRVDDGGVQSDSLGEQGDLVLLSPVRRDARKRVARAKWLR